MQRMNALDAHLLSHDVAETPRHVASLVLVRAGDPALDYEALVGLVLERIDLVPRYRQVVRRMPGGLGAPVWIDDEHFDVSLHVRRSALPQPGTREALNEFVSRLIARRLDHDRPLWELYLIEGLESGEVALLFKAHQALVDGSHTVDLSHVLFEDSPRERDVPHDEWVPRAGPTTTDLVIGAVIDQLADPASLVRTASFVVERLASKVPGLSSEPDAHGPLHAPLSRHRRFATVSLPLEDLRKVRAEHGGTVNDVVITVIAGGLRGWLLTRAVRITNKTSFRAMVPMSVAVDHDDEAVQTSLGPRVRGYIVALPVGEPNAVVRLHQVSYSLKSHRETGTAIGADTLADLPGFTTSTFHAVGARVAEEESRRPYHLVVTNVPGPREPMYVAGREMSEIYAAVPLTGSRALSIAVTSYNGAVSFGVVADHEAVPDLDVLAQCINESAEELVESLSGRRRRAPRGRQRPAAREEP